MNMAIINHDSQHLRGVVDMGSNGIRFSISTLQPPTARIMPTLYQHRIGISLYDAQYSASGERKPIDDQTIKAVITAFQHFQRTCADFGVPSKQITVLATEATRTAMNSEDFRKRIKDAVGWEVSMLPKEEEGRIGGMGIASSLPEVVGLVMDLGGGSTQLSWLMHSRDGEVRMPESGSVSMPFGAAAMTRRWGEAEREGRTEGLGEEIRRAAKEAYEKIHVPEELERVGREERGFTLYLSGGGFRGWGYVLMSRNRDSPYPIPVINGFKASREDFMDIESVKTAAAATLQNEDDEIFRVSDRRASQVPAVAFLINALMQALPQIKEVRFCQGGVREGFLFSSLDREVQAEHPLVIATQPFTPVSSKPVLDLLKNAIPPTSEADTKVDGTTNLEPDVLEAFANLMYYHASHSKDLQASSALRSTTCGIIAGVHGFLHEHRALLGLLLCARWGGDVPPTDRAFHKGLEDVVGSRWKLWWVQYVGAVAALIAAVCPTGLNNEEQASRIVLKTSWTELTKSGHPVLLLHIQLPSYSDVEIVSKEIKTIEKVGKKRNWIGGMKGDGYKVIVETTTHANK